jgi:isopenicillin-N N-acyltransferase-like protein
MIARFPRHRLHGSHHEVGRQHGEALRAEIRAHLELIYTQGARRSSLAPETARRWAVTFGPVIGEAAPHFLDEIEGVAEGAGIEPAEALLLQVRIPAPAGPLRARTPTSRAASRPSARCSPSR